MKKIALSTLLMAGIAFAKPIQYGILKGNVKTYYPNVTISNSFEVSNVSTSGITANKAQTLYDIKNKFLKGFKKDAKENCKNNKAYAIDNVNLSFDTFGDYNNMLVYVSANIVCID